MNKWYNFRFWLCQKDMFHTWSLYDDRNRECERCWARQFQLWGWYWVPARGREELELLKSIREVIE